MTLSIEELRQRYSYDPVTGELRHRHNFGRAKSGSLVGAVTEEGYLRTNVRKVGYLVHRIVWAHVNGVWPNGVIDHIDGNTQNNRIGNLRDVSRRVNGQNQVSHRDGKLPGTSYDSRRGKYRARYKTGNQEHWIGYFTTEQDAHEAYMKTVGVLCK